MNPNIKVINKNLWMVNFSYVGMDFIKEITFKKSTDADFMCLSQDGKLIMNSGDELSHKTLPMMKVVMTLPNRLLGNEGGFCFFVKVFIPKLDKLTNDELLEFVKQQNLVNMKAVFDTACKWEKERRQLHKKYIREHWFSIGINKLLHRKGVKENGKY
jgi:hypothetical protein